MKIIRGVFFTKNRGMVEIEPAHLAVIKLNPSQYLQTFDEAIKKNEDINGYMFLLESEDKNDS